MAKQLLLLCLALGLAFPAAARAKRADQVTRGAARSAKDPEDRAPEKRAADKRAPEKAATPRSKTQAPERLAKRDRAPRDRGPCFAPQVHVTRVRGSEVEHRDLSLTLCDGTPNPAAVDSISVLARPRDVERPLLAEIKAYQKRPVDRGPVAKRRKPAYLTDRVMRVHAGLLVRLQKVAQRFPGKTIEIISGYRPDARETSRHHHGRALDMRVAGLSRETLRDFLRTLDATGVGYYPNSYFVHMDVREDRGYWVDRSGPGERPDYGPWPPRKTDIEVASAKLVRGALRDLEQLGRATASAPPPDMAARAMENQRSAELSPKLVEREQPAASDAPPVDEPDDLSPAEVTRIRRDAMRAVRGL